MSNYKAEYQKFLARPESARLAGDVSLIYVPTTTRFDQPSSVISHLSKQAQILKTKRQAITGAIEGSDAICLDVETTIEFTHGGGAYLPSLDHVSVDQVTFPTIHIVHFNSEHQIKQIRIHWDQASLLREVKVIGISGRAWPIRNVVDQMNLLKNAATARSTAAVPGEENKSPLRPSSPQKHYVKDPYAAGSLTELISPSKNAAESNFVGKKYIPDPYGAGSLEEILSPSKKTPAPVAPYAPSSQPRAVRNPSDIFLKDDDDVPAPPTPTKAKRSAPQVPKEDDSRPEPPAEDQPIKAVSDKLKHFEIASDNSETELKDDTKNPNSNCTPRGAQARHVDLASDKKEKEGRIISSYGNRGDDLYVNHIFHESDTPEKKKEGRIISSYGNRGDDLYANHIFHESATPEKPAAKHEQAVKMMESHWDNYDERTQTPPYIPATSQRNRHNYNQPSWSFGDQ